MTANRSNLSTLHAIFIKGIFFLDALFERIGWLLSRVQSQDQSSRKGKGGRGGDTSERECVCVCV